MEFLISGGRSNKCSNICSEHPSMCTPLTVASWAPLIPCPYGQHKQRVSATRRELPTKTTCPFLLFPFEGAPCPAGGAEKHAAVGPSHLAFLLLLGALARRWRLGGRGLRLALSTRAPGDKRLEGRHPLHPQVQVDVAPGQ